MGTFTPLLMSYRWTRTVSVPYYCPVQVVRRRLQLRMRFPWSHKRPRGRRRFDIKIIIILYANVGLHTLVECDTRADINHNIYDVWGVHTTRHTIVVSFLPKWKVSGDTLILYYRAFGYDLHSTGGIVLSGVFRGRLRG